MPKRPFLYLFCVLTLCLPTLSFADQKVQFKEDLTPAVAIVSPLLPVYTRLDSVYPTVVFASTSKIVEVEYMLNGVDVPYDRILPFADQPLGTTTFTVITSNLEGEIATTTTTFTLIATPESTLFDIKQAYKDGLITKAVIRDRFLRSLDLYVDASNKREKLLSGNDKRKDERALILSERMEKLLSGDILELLKKQEGRTVKKEAADLIREDIASLKEEAGL